MQDVFCVSRKQHVPQMTECGRGRMQGSRSRPTLLFGERKRRHKLLCAGKSLRDTCIRCLRRLFCDCVVLPQRLECFPAQASQCKVPLVCVRGTTIRQFLLLIAARSTHFTTRNSARAAWIHYEAGHPPKSLPPAALSERYLKSDFDFSSRAVQLQYMLVLCWP